MQLNTLYFLLVLSSWAVLDNIIIKQRMMEIMEITGKKERNPTKNNTMKRKTNKILMQKCIGSKKDIDFQIGLPEPDLFSFSLNNHPKFVNHKYANTKLSTKERMAVNNRVINGPNNNTNISGK